MKNRVITISRQFGSGGRTIGKEVAQKLGIPCYDQELIEKIAEDTGLTAEFVSDHTENTLYSTILASAFGTYSATATQDYLWDIQVKIISKLAEEGPCVIVGRCADYVLRDHPRALNVFITADPADRIRRICDSMQVSQAEAEKLMHQGDADRAAYYNFYTAGHWGAAAGYHLCLNSSVCGIEGAVEIIKDFARRKLG